MGIYVVQVGDTFETIARRQYGDDLRAPLISGANPGVSLPLQAGVTLTIPADITTPPDAPGPVFGATVNDVVVSIDGTHFTKWDQVSVLRSVDRFDTIELRAPFEPDDVELKEKLKPFSYKPLSVSVGGNPLFTGVMVGINPTVEPSRNLVIAAGYSKPGTLNDCTLPVSSVDVEFKGMTLLQIAETVAGSFGLSVEIDGEPGPVFDTVAHPVSQKVYSWLSGLAKQRGYVIGSTAEGVLSFRKSVEPGAPVAVLAEGSGPVMSVSPLFNEQEYYSHVTGARPDAIGIAGELYTEPNVRLQGVIRPYSFTANDTDSADIKAAVQSKMGRMFANSVRYSVPVATWRDDAGNLWEPNTTIKLTAPRSMVYSEYEFVIRAVDFFRNANAETALLDLMLPGGFAGTIPGSLPWD